jgi:hypothetical protein
VCGTDSVLADATRTIRTLCRKRDWPFRSMVWKHKKRESLPAEPGGSEGIDDFARFLSAHELVVTGRFHTVTYCLLTDTPFIAVESNTDKISRMIEEALGNTNRMVSANELEALDPHRFSGWTAAERKTKRSYLRESRNSITAMMAEIRDRVHSCSDHGTPDPPTRGES